MILIGTGTGIVLVKYNIMFKINIFVPPGLPCALRFKSPGSLTSLTPADICVHINYGPSSQSVLLLWHQSLHRILVGVKY